jgi:hypothetical protein
MSKLIKYPSGAVAKVSDAVAAILALRDGHRIVHAMPPVNTVNPTFTFRDGENKQETANA